MKWLYNVKKVARSDDTTDEYHLTLQFLKIQDYIFLLSLSRV